MLWPTDTWPASSPEEQGINSAVLDTLVQEMRTGEHGSIDAFMTIRNGYVRAVPFRCPRTGPGSGIQQLEFVRPPQQVDDWCISERDIACGSIKS